MAEENREVSMTVTTTIRISHKEMENLKLTDNYLKKLGYQLKTSTSYGKVFEKIFYSNRVDAIRGE